MELPTELRSHVTSWFSGYFYIANKKRIPSATCFSQCPYPSLLQAGLSYENPTRSTAKLTDGGAQCQSK